MFWRIHYQCIQCIRSTPQMSVIHMALKILGWFTWWKTTFSLSMCSSEEQRFLLEYLLLFSTCSLMLTPELRFSICKQRYFKKLKSHVETIDMYTHESGSVIHSFVFDSVTPWTVAWESSLSLEFSRQEYWSGLPFPSPRDLPEPGIEPWSPEMRVHSLLCEPPGKPTYALMWTKITFAKL